MVPVANKLSCESKFPSMNISTLAGPRGLCIYFLICYHINEFFYWWFLYLAWYSRCRDSVEVGLVANPSIGTSFYSGHWLCSQCTKDIYYWTCTCFPIPHVPLLEDLYWISDTFSYSSSNCTFYHSGCSTNCAACTSSTVCTVCEIGYRLVSTSTTSGSVTTTTVTCSSRSSFISKLIKCTKYTFHCLLWANPG